MSEATTGKRLRGNVRSLVFTWGWFSLLQILKGPIIIYYLELEGYGLWVLAFCILSYFTFYNFGVNTAYVKYTAECHAKGEYTRLGRLLSTGMVLGALIGVLIIFALFALTDRIVEFFKVFFQSIDQFNGLENRFEQTIICSAENFPGKGT